MAAVLDRNCLPHTASIRYNIYAVVHKGLRGFMMDTLCRVGRMDATDECELAQAIEQVRSLLSFCISHLEHENEYLHPAIERANAYGAVRTADDHVGHRLEIAELEQSIARLLSAPAEHRIRLAAELYRSLSGFIAENFEHMLVEETINHEVLIASYTDEDLLAIEAAIIAATPPEENITWMRWMIRHINAAERAFLLKGVKLNAPAEAFAAVLGIAREELSERDFYKLERALT